MNASKFSISGLDSRIGFHAGVKAELGLPQVTEGAYMDFGALLTLKGAKLDGGAAGNIKFNPYYLEIPVHIGYKYAVMMILLCLPMLVRILQLDYSVKQKLKSMMTLVLIWALTVRHQKTFLETTDSSASILGWG